MHYPLYRPRRMREKEALRSMIRETQLSVNDLIQPFFVTHGKGQRREISSMPGNFQLSPDELVKEAREVERLGIPAILLFGIPATKDAVGSEAYHPCGVVQEAVRAVKREISELLVITDVCLCEYTSHGHCGIIEGGQLKNDPTLELLAKTALSQVEAGADMVAPSDMMDGRVSAIREALDEAGHQEIPIMSYAAKYASSFYAPFREAAESGPQFGDRKSYQMDPANIDEAMREISLDLEEGADIIMVKPALSYLDVLWRAKHEFGIPVAAYSASGEFAMIKAASQLGWLEEEKVMMEVLTSIKRAGADLIVTYFAREAARFLGR